MAFHAEDASNARSSVRDTARDRLAGWYAQANAGRAFVVTMALAVFGCGEKTAEPAETPPDSTPSLSPMDLSRLHDAVAGIISNSCSYTRCHGHLVANAGLVFSATSNFRDILVDVTSCEYDLMPRVKPGKPLESWVMIKLTSPVYDQPDRMGLIQFTPDPAWVPKEGPCATTASDGTPLFGMRMPATAPNMLSDADLASFKQWIEAGAP